MSDPRPHPQPDEPSTAERAGGIDAFVELVDRFYARVEGDEVLRPMYPDDLEPGKRHLALFFAQYWGAGDVYSSERGHPRLRMRHAPFAIDRDAALRWATHMAEAIRSMRFPSDVEHALLTYVARFTPSMINRADELLRESGELPQE
jgi:hemoglobin